MHGPKDGAFVKKMPQAQIATRFDWSSAQEDLGHDHDHDQDNDHESPDDGEAYGIWQISGNCRTCGVYGHRAVDCNQCYGMNTKGGKGGKGQKGGKGGYGGRY